MISGVRKVWLDVDTGVDDAHAMLLALRSPELFVCGISCVAGEEIQIIPETDVSFIYLYQINRKCGCGHSFGIHAQGL
jgi:inosine-uridine nucleoside N-ribohydrolase